MNSQIEALDELNNPEYKKNRKNSSRKCRFYRLLTYLFCKTTSLLGFNFQGFRAEFKIRHIFFGAERWSGSRKNQWSGGAFPSEKFGADQSGGAEILENFHFLVFFMNFSRLIAQGGLKRSPITPDAIARC